MPVPYHKLKPGKHYTLREAASVGNMVLVRCYLCHRPAQVFLASDLIQILDPDRDAYLPPFPCGKCGSTEFVNVQLRTPVDADIDKLVVRRLVRVDLKPIWRNERYVFTPRRPDPTSDPPRQS